MLKELGRKLEIREMIRFQKEINMENTIMKTEDENEKRGKIKQK
jgi:hypothetical protein